MATMLTDAREEKIATIEALDPRLRWLSAWIVHNANHIREKCEGLNVGGQQASCASITAIMAALYFHALRPQDKVSVKPHAGPVLHAIHYLLGNQTLEQLSMRVSPLGTDRFGQTGDLPDLYGEYRLDAVAIVDATAELFRIQISIIKNIMVSPAGFEPATY